MTITPPVRRLAEADYCWDCLAVGAGEVRR